MRWLVLLCCLSPALAEAQIYKFTKPNGTVVYTDNLAQLPQEQQRHYAEEERKRAEERQRLEASLGKEELERREAEAKRQLLERQQMDEAERRRQMEELDQAILEIQKRRAEREGVWNQWRQKIVAARAQQQEVWKKYQAALATFESLGIKPSFSWLPGEAEQFEQAQKDMERWGKELEALNQLIEFTIPDQARKAGVPPGYLR